MTIKLDIGKEYDRLEWPLIKKCLLTLVLVIKD